jgi:hypothetical protein
LMGVSRWQSLARKANEVQQDEWERGPSRAVVKPARRSTRKK